MICETREHFFQSSGILPADYSFEGKLKARLWGVNLQKTGGTISQTELQNHNAGVNPCTSCKSFCRISV